MIISQSAFDLIVREEVSSEAYYKRHYQQPEWPGVSSGVTVGIGYDLGQASRQKIAADWTGLVSSDMLLVMASCSGITGNSANSKCVEVKHTVVIPWDQALLVFKDRDVPAWTWAVIKACPGAERLTPTCLGVIVSLAYNRGASFSLSGERYLEMRAIRQAIIDKRYSDIPGLIRRMERLWPSVRGLRDRREHEAALFEKGLAGSEGPAGLPPTLGRDGGVVPINAGPARTKPSATSTSQNTTTGGIVVGGAAVAIQGGFSIWTGLAIFGATVVAALAVWLFWYWHRNPT